jgi:hypothetical protein
MITTLYYLNGAVNDLLVDNVDLELGSYSATTAVENACGRFSLSKHHDKHPKIRFRLVMVFVVI